MRRARRRTRYVIVLGSVSALALACGVASSSSPQQDGGELLRPLDTGGPSDAGVDAWTDCVGVLRVIELRGVPVANARRFGEDAGGLQLTARVADLTPAELGAFCDWEACIRANGYAHACAVNDAGWESCHVCRSGSDCDGAPLSQDDCVRQAEVPGTAECGVGLLEECLLQRAVRGPGYPCETETCRLSEQACAGQLPGDLLAQVIAARKETDQLAIEEFRDEIALEQRVDPDSGFLSYWQGQLALWDGGSSSCATVDAGDAGEQDAASGD